MKIRKLAVFEITASDGKLLRGATGYVFGKKTYVFDEEDAEEYEEIDEEEYYKKHRIDDKELDELLTRY